jgi:hypothetical protein
MVIVPALPTPLPVEKAEMLQGSEQSSLVLFALIFPFVFVSGFVFVFGFVVKVPVARK